MSPRHDIVAVVFVFFILFKFVALPNNITLKLDIK